MVFYGLLSHAHGMLHAEAGLDPARKPREPLAAASDIACPLLAFFGEDDEFVQFYDPRSGVYKAVVVRDGTLIGAMLLGDIGKASMLAQAFDGKIDLPEDRAALLFDIGEPQGPDVAADLPDDTQVCNCNGVTKGDLVNAPGAAFRDRGHWYGLRYSCSLTPDHMKTKALRYAVGHEIPESDWEQYGLWR